MKTLFLIALLSLSSLVCRGASVPFTAFRGTGGIVTTTNPTLGTVTIDGSGVAGGSGSVTNVTASTNCVTVANANTNLIIVSGMGGGTNGHYRFKPDHNPGEPVWTSTVSRTLAIWHDTGDAFITNSSGILNTLSGAGVPPIGAWDSGGTSAFDNVTNCIPYDFSLTARTNVIYINCGDTEFLGKISNCPNNAVITIGPCPQGYPYATWAYGSNRTAVPLSLVNKTNVELVGYGMPYFDTSQTPYGDTMMVSNCSGIWIHGVGFRSMRNTNGTGPALPHPHVLAVGVWSALRYINCENLRIENNSFVNHNNQGILDTGGSGVVAGQHPSTNRIEIIRNYFKNIGNWFPTNAASHAGGAFTPTYDGAAIVPTGALVDGNFMLNVVSGIEPFANVGTNLYFKLLNNWVENYLHYGIQDGGGSTPFNGSEIIGNTVKLNIGFLRDGTNSVGEGAGIKTSCPNPIRISGNKIHNVVGSGIHAVLGTPGNGLQIDNNFIFNTTNHVAGSSAYGIYLEGSVMANARLFNNEIYRSGNAGILVYTQLRDSEIAANTILCPNMSSAGGGSGIDFVLAGASNVVVRNNVIRDTNATPRMAYGISLIVGVRKILCTDNVIQNALTALILNSSGAEVSVDGTWPLGTTNVTTFVGGKYTNNVWDRLVGIGDSGARTNVLPNASDTNYFDWPLTVHDRATTATTQVVLLTVAGQLINGGPTITNLATNGGSITLKSDRVGWRILGAFP